MPTKDGKQFQRLVESFGFRLAGFDSAGHAMWWHPSFSPFRTSSTPTSGHAWRIARRVLYQAMGLRPPMDKRRRPEQPSALSILVVRARRRGYGLTQSQARELLSEFDGDLAGAESELDLRCDWWDARKKRDRSERSEAQVTKLARVDPAIWPVVHARILRDLRFELDARSAANARRMALSMRDVLREHTSTRRWPELTREAA